MKKIDLHIHTKVSSDGSYLPEKIVEMASLKKMNLISITDHNSVRAVECALKAAQMTDVSVVSGIEIDCEFEGIHFHLTGYGIDVHDIGFAQVEEYYHHLAVKVTWEGTTSLMKQMGLNLSDEVLHSISNRGMIVPEDLADYLLSHHEYDHLDWLNPYRKGGNRSDNPNVNFYWDFFSQGKIGFMKSVNKTAEEMIDLIHKTGGVAVIAHPGQNFRGKDEVLERLLQKVDGLEVYSSYHSEEDVRFYRQMALNQHKLISAGTDYHGHHKPMIELGSIGGICEADAEKLFEVMEGLIK